MSLIGSSINITNGVTKTNDCSDHGYPEFLELVKRNFNLAISCGERLFTTDASGLWEAYLDNLPSDSKQYFDCRACKHFIERFGGLVTISVKGNIKSAIWKEKEIPMFFIESVKAMKEIVQKARVNGVFIGSTRVLGEPVTGEWTHLSVSLPDDMINHSKLLTAEQVMAEKLEDFKMAKNALMIYSDNAVDTAVTLLKTESLYRSEKCLGVAEWFRDLHQKCSIVKNLRNKENIIWSAVATAPAGFCHVKSSMIGTLLDDITSGMPFNMVSRRFAEKMQPTQYQRPQSAPSAGNIRQAEKIVEKLGIKNSLVRRYARLDELETVWKDIDERDSKHNFSGGVFSHIQPKEKREQPRMSYDDLPIITMTWDKFSRTVLPTAMGIDYYVPSGLGNYSAIVTASDFNAPPILQWDREEQRNPFSWYLYNGGSYYGDWNLSLGYCKVTGITLQPSMWHGENAQQGKGLFLILEGARDKRHNEIGNALFPEILRPELREIRATIEAYSKDSKIEGYEESSACGVNPQYGDTHFNAKLRVQTPTGTVVFKLDRWD